MVIVAAFGARLGVRAGPGGDVHRVDRGTDFGAAVIQRVAGEQLSQCLRIDRSLAEGRVEAPPSAAVNRCQAKVDGGWSAIACQDRVDELEEAILPLAQADMEPSAKGP